MAMPLTAIPMPSSFSRGVGGHVPSGRLDDIDGGDVILGKLPMAPSGTSISRVDVVIRLEDK